MEYAISDATGRTIPSANSPTLSNLEGATEPTPPTPAPALAVTPASVSTATCAGKTFSFFTTGGTSPYSALITPQPGGIVVTRENDGATFTVSGITVDDKYTLTVYDQTNPQKTATATITCSAGP